MKMFNAIAKLFRGAHEPEPKAPQGHCVIVAPMTGTMVPLKQVPDPTFAQTLVGDGCAILPTGPEVVAPADGRITKLFKTQHALTIELKNGLICLVHCGINTVELGGEGFHVHVQEGDEVKQGQSLLSLDLSFLSQRAKSLISPILITNPEKLSKQVICLSDGDITQAGLTPIFNLTLQN